MGQISIARGVVAIDPTSAPGVPLYTDVTSPQVLYSGASGLISGSAKFQWINSTSSLEFGTGAEIYLYNTADQTTDYERGVVKWDTNAYVIGTEKGGTGSSRTLNFQVDGTSRWYITTAGHFQTTSSNGYDIGASGSLVRSLYYGTNLDGASGATFNLYNTADQTTNYERLRAVWVSNQSVIFNGIGGTGQPRTLLLGNSATAGGNVPTRGIAIYAPAAAAIGVEVFYSTSTASTAVLGISTSTVLSASTGTQQGVNIAPTINQSGTAGYTALDVNPTESSTGSGTKLLQRWALGGTAVSTLNNAGQLAAAGLYATSSGINLGGTLGAADVRLFRDAAAVLALRDGTNAQTFRVYNTYTDGSNYRRWNLSWDTTTAIMQVVGAGTGTNGNLAVGNAALATNATVGYFMIPSSAGAPTGVPADIPTGQVALHFDSTNNKLYVYDGGWLSTAALT